MTALNTLAPQSYGIACAQTRFGGPRGVWLECHECPTSDRIVGSNSEAGMMMTDAEAAAVFRLHGWSGDGDRMLKARCPKCSAVPV